MGAQRGEDLLGSWGEQEGEEWGWLPVGAGLSKLGMKVRSWHGRARGEQHLGRRARWGQAGAGCSWERPEHSLQTDSAARRPRPAYLPCLGEGVGRRAGQHSRLPGAWGGRTPGQAGPSHPWQGTRISSWGPNATVGYTVIPLPTGDSGSAPPGLPHPWEALAAKSHSSSNLGLSLFVQKSLSPLS